MTSIGERIVQYREMQRAVPGVGGLYALLRAAIEKQLPKGGHLLIVGAGGGREIEELAESKKTYRVTAVDPSADNLEGAKHIAEKSCMMDRVRFVQGRVEDLAAVEHAFDAASSLLVMHGLPDDGSKLSYLKAIHSRLAPGAALVHADVCVETTAEFDAMVPLYQHHAARQGIDPELAAIDPRVIPSLPIINGARTKDLFEEAGFSHAQEVFRSLWYRCWVSTATPL